MSAVARQIPFHGGPITLVESNGQPFVAVRPICDRLGLDWGGQWTKLRDPQNGWTCRAIPTHDTSGRLQEMVCLALIDFPLWLASISPSRVAEKVRPAFLRYREEAKRVLFDHFIGQRDHWKQQADALAAELFTRKPIFARVLLLAQDGHDFDGIWKSTSYSKAKVADALRYIVQLGRMEALPAGTPAVTTGNVRPTPQSDGQLSLFGGA